MIGFLSVKSAVYFLIVILFTVSQSYLQRWNLEGNKVVVLQQEHTYQRGNLNHSSVPIEQKLCLLNEGFNYIQCFHLRAMSNLPEEHYRTKVLIPGNTENDLEADNIIWLNPGKRGLPNFTPYISVGVLSNLEEFFDNLSSNMDSIDEEKTVVNEIEADQPLKIKSPLAENYFRGYKPSYKIRNYVQSPDLGLLKGTNHHDPSLKWSGLGKRSRA